MPGYPKNFSLPSGMISGSPGMGLTSPGALPAGSLPTIFKALILIFLDFSLFDFPHQQKNNEQIKPIKMPAPTVRPMISQIDTEEVRSDPSTVTKVDGPLVGTIDGAEVSVGLIVGAEVSVRLIDGATVIDGIDVGSTVVAVGKFEGAIVRTTGDVVGVQSSGLLPHQVPSHTLQLDFLTWHQSVNTR